MESCLCLCLMKHTIIGHSMFHLLPSMQGLYRGSENNEMRLGVCSRSNDVIEPMIKPQWYVNCSDIAKEALHAVTDEENKRVEIFPKQYVADWKRCLYIHFCPYNL